MRIGLTGGIASGKSLVADLFAQLGVQVIDTDLLARQVVEPGQPALRAIVDHFGQAVLDEHGALDRRALRNHVFADDDARQKLESIVHPHIRDLVNQQLAEADGPYQIIVVPLLAETGYAERVDRVLVVDCPREIQLARLKARDGENTASAERILNAQASRDRRLALADDVINNAGSREETAQQVRTLHGQYLELCRAA